MIANELHDKLAKVPHAPGCYLWKDGKGRIVYVGKAKDLFKRTHQYFTGATNQRTQQLVSEIRDLDYIIVNSNREAMILENNLIKKHLPRYNVLLKDGSGYPYIQITNEKDPKIIYTRNLVKSRGKFYGPFPDGTRAYRLYTMLNTLFPLRKCPTVPGKKCIYYDIGQCLAPCINTVTPEQYKQVKAQIDDLFSGRNETLLADLSKKEIDAAEKMDYEAALKYKELQAALGEAGKEQNVELKHGNDTDVIGFYEDKNMLSLVIFSYYGGKLLTKHQEILELHVSTEEALVSYLMQYYTKNRVPSNILLSISDEGFLSDALGINVTNPTKGSGKTIMRTAIKNARQILTEKIDLHSRQAAKTSGAIMELARLLNIESAETIEAFDNSNIQGTNAVGAMVVFKGGQKNRNAYRKFNVKTVEGANDVATFKEILYRRYFRLLSEKAQMPDLIIVDGGEPQVLAAKEVLGSLYLQIPLIGLAKDDRHRTHEIVDANLKHIPLAKDSNVFFLLANIQEEVHRYAITFFRRKQLKSMIRSSLDGIPGLGPVSQQRLLENYQNIAAIKAATVEELTQFVPRKTAENIKQILK